MNCQIYELVYVFDTPPGSIEADMFAGVHVSIWQYIWECILIVMIQMIELLNRN